MSAAAIDLGIAEPTRDLRLVAAPRPLSPARVDRVLPAGATIAELLAELELPPWSDGNVVDVRVQVDDWAIPRSKWHAVRPRAGRLVTVAVVPAGGGGGKNPIRFALQFAVVVASIFVAPYVAPFVQTALGVTEATALAISQAGIGLIGSLAVNALAPPPRPKPWRLDGGDDRPVFSIAGAGNRPNPWGVAPLLLGERRIWPPIGGNYYTEIVGDDQYVRLAGFISINRCRLRDWRIGETPIDQFEGVELEVREGGTDDAPLALYANDVAEVSTGAIELRNADGWTTRRTLENVDEISLDLVATIGLRDLEEDEAISVSIEIQYAVAGSGTWQPVEILTLSDRTNSPVRRGHRWTVARGQYDVRARRVTADYGSSKILDRIVWTVLRSIRHVEPIDIPGCCRFAMRIKATPQTQGVLDQINCIATSVLPDWTGTGWVEQPTSLPASLYRAVLQQPWHRRPLPDSRVDLAAIEAWGDDCLAKGWRYDAYIDWAATVGELREDIAAAGRAARSMSLDGRFSVVVDRPEAVPVQLFTPRNSRGFRSLKTFRRLPHALRVGYVNPEVGWQSDEVIVYADGYDATTATDFEQVDLYWCVVAALAWRHGRFWHAEGKLRPETYELQTDFEYRVAQRGQTVAVAHDSIRVGLGAARVVSVSAADSQVTAIALDTPMPMAADKSYGITWRKALGTLELSAGVQTVAGESRTLIPTATIAAGDIEPGDLVAFGELGRETLLAQLKDIIPDRDWTATLRLRPAAPEVHDADQGPVPDFDPVVTLPPNAGARAPAVPAIAAIASDETVLAEAPDGTLVPRIAVSLAPRSGGGLAPDAYQARHRRDGDSVWRPGPQVAAPADGLAIDGVEEGRTYLVAVRAIAGGVASAWSAEVAHTVIGKSTLPPAPPTLVRRGDAAVWTYPAPPRDLAGFDVRAQPGVLEEWETALPLAGGTLVAGTQASLAGLPPGTWTVMVKAVDDSGNASAEPAVMVIGLGDPVLANVIETVDFAASGWPGDLAGGTVQAGELRADGGAGLYLPDGGALYLPDGAGLYLDAQYEAMTYTATLVPEAATVPARLTLAVDVASPRWTVELLAPDGALYLPEADAPYLPEADAPYLPGTGTWVPWPGAIEGATRQPYGLRISTPAGQYRGVVRGLSAVLDVADVAETIADAAIPAGGARLALAGTYRAIKAVGLTLQDDGGTARSAQLGDRSTAGPLVICRDAAGAPAAGTVTATVQGY